MLDYIHRNPVKSFALACGPVLCLADTETIYTRVEQMIAQPYGKEFTWDLKLKMMGRKEQEGARIFIGKT